VDGIIIIEASPTVAVTRRKGDMSSPIREVIEFASKAPPGIVIIISDVLPPSLYWLIKVFLVRMCPSVGWQVDGRGFFFSFQKLERIPGVSMPVRFAPLITDGRCVYQIEGWVSSLS